MGGPIWSDPIHDKTFVQELLEAIKVQPLCELGTQRRMLGMLTVVQEELDDVPLYYTLDKLCCVLKLEIVPILKFRSALLNAGYKVSFSHAYKNSIKTNASASVLWDILRCWNKRHPVKEDRMVEGTPIKSILGKECSQEYDFDSIHVEANPTSRKQALSRFQANPTSHWGPGTRATIMYVIFVFLRIYFVESGIGFYRIGEEKVGKSHRNQNKKQKHKAAESNEHEEQKAKQAKIEETEAS